MRYILDDNSRKRLLGKAAKYLHDLGANDIDGFLTRLIAKIVEYVEQEGEFPEENEIHSLINQIKTSLFRSCRVITRDKFALWFLRTLQAEGVNVIRAKQKTETTADREVVRVSIDDIDSFQKVKSVSPCDVRDQVPLEFPESQIKQFFADILGEPFVSKDWGGEIADLFSTHLIYQGKRQSVGFLLKGPGIKSIALTINRLGKNGDQIVRLTSVSLDLYIVQFVGFISQPVIEHLEAQVKQTARKAGKSRYYCIIDGTDTARLLKAYGKL